MEKLNELEKEDLIRKFMTLWGSLKKGTTDQDLRRIREKVWKEYRKERGGG